MSRSRLLRQNDIVEIVRLVNECRDLGADVVAWQSHFARRAALLAGADFCLVSEEPPLERIDAFTHSQRPPEFAVWGWENGFNNKIWPGLMEKFITMGPTFNPMYAPYRSRHIQDPGLALTNNDLLESSAWENNEYHGDYHRPSGAGAMMYAHLDSPKTTHGGCLITLIRGGNSGDFSRRSRSVMKSLSLSIGDLLGGPLASFADPNPAALTPRCRQVLACMLLGESDKEIGLRLNITRNTVNQYAKTIFTHFVVNSRPELLARWIQRGWGPVRLAD